MRLRFSRTALAALVASTCLAFPVAAHAQNTTATTAPAATSTVTAPKASPAITAKTVQLQETFSVGGREGTLSPFFTVSVQIAGQDHIRMDVKPVPSPNRSKEKPSQYLLDGKNEYEYNGIYNYYTSSPAPTPEKRSHSQLRDMAAVEVILHGEPTMATDPNVTKTVSEETLDGRKLVVTTYALPAQKRGDAMIASATRVWIDPETGLPVRSQECGIQDGKTSVYLQTDFSGWKLDETVAPQQFVWQAPAGSHPYEGPKVANVGKVAPDFTAYAPDGKPIKLSDFKGKIVVLDSWATWCGPCQRSMPHLEKVYQQIKSQDVVVLAVCVWDQKPEYDKWVKAKQGVYSFPTVFDTAGRADNNIAKALYQVDGIPTQFIIGKDGKIAAGTIGYDEKVNFLEGALAKLGVKINAPAQPAAPTPAR